MLRNRTRNVIEFMVHAIFWLGMYYALRALTVSNFKMLTGDNGRAPGQMTVNVLFPWSGVVLGFLIVLFYSNSFWLFGKLIRYKYKALSVVIISGWAMLLFAIDFLLIRTLIGSTGNINIRTNPGMPPPPADGGFSVRDWSDMQLTTGLVFLAIIGISVAYFFSKEFVRNDLARSKAEAHQLSTEIRFLRSQVNPHFLFNTLNNLFSMAQKKGNDELADGISKLSGMMRYMIYESNTGNVPLQKEIEYLGDCIALNKLRYASDEVSVIVNYPPPLTITGVQVAPMLFISFLENAFKHGVLIGRHSVITVTISVEQKNLIFTCENPDYGASKKMHEESAGIGLENVKRRLQLLYPGSHELQVIQENGKYIVHLQITLP